jgi:nitrite reductase/ring-hydroxylating ferredoxin subunit
MRCGACLADATARDLTLACSRCDWHYDLVTGEVIGVPALRLRTFNARRAGSRIWIEDR